MTLEQFIALLGNGSSFTLLLVFVFAVATGRLIFQRESDKDRSHTLELLKLKDERIADLQLQLSAAIKETEQWQGMALRGAHLAVKSVDLAANATGTGTG
jgi:hypothetical protein